MHKNTIAHKGSDFPYKFCHHLSEILFPFKPVFHSLIGTMSAVTCLSIMTVLNPRGRYDSSSASPILEFQLVFYPSILRIMRPEFIRNSGNLFGTLTNLRGTRVNYWEFRINSRHIFLSAWKKVGIQSSVL